MSLQTENLTLCDPLVMDLVLRRDVDRSEVYRALVALGDDVFDMLPVAYRDQPDTLDRRLVAWGYGIASIIGNTRRLGIYGDYTAHEHDVIVLPALAPFMEDDSRYIYRESGGFRDVLRGWVFETGRVTLREVERVIDYEIGRAL